MKQKEYRLNVGDFAKLYNENRLDISFEINKDMIIGRKDVWSISDKSMLIHSILSDYLLMPIVLIKKVNFYTEEQEGNTEFSVLDGKQRLMCLIEYIKDNYPLYDLTPPIKTTEIKNLKFSQLSKKLQKKILDFEFIVYENDGTFEENIEMFIRYNNGTPPKAIELFRAKLGLHSQLLNEISSHNLFSLINLNGIQRFQDYELALYLLMLQTDSTKGLSKKDKEIFVDNLSKKKNISKSVREKLNKKLDFLYEAFNRPEYIELKWEDKYLKKSHLTSMYLLLDKAINKGITPEQFYKWANTFFLIQKDVTNNYWIEVSRGSTTSKSSMNIRNNELMSNFKVYLAEIERDNQKIINIFTKRKLN